MKRFLRTAAPWALGAVLVCIGTFEMNKVFLMAFSPPFKYSKIYTDTPEVKVGGDLIIVYEFTRKRFCHATLDRLIRKKDGSKTVVWRESVVIGSDLGFNRTRNQITLPAKIQPGEYEISGDAYSLCYEGIHTEITPKVDFRVVP